MKIGFLIALIGLVWFAGTTSKIELEKRLLLDDKVEILLPTDFEPMSEELLKLKYPFERRPTLVYTDETGGINVAFNHTPSKLTQPEIELFRKEFVKMLSNAHPSAKWKNTGVEEINGRKVGFLELITPAIDTDIYNLMFFTDLEGRMLLCTFNCVVKKHKIWLEPAKQMMNSLVIRE
jgi:hypothetical protein